MAHRVANHVGYAPVTDAEQGLSPKVRETVVALYTRASRDWQRAPAEVARGLREARHLHSRDRRFVADALHSMIRMRRRLAFAIGLDDDEAASPPPDLLYLAWLVDAGQSPKVIDALQQAGGRLSSNALDTIADPIRRLAIARSFPDWLVARLVDELGDDEADAFLRASNKRAPLIARVNTLKNSVDELVQILAAEGVEARRVELAPSALELDGHHNAYALASFREGRFELQDTASQLVAEIVAPPPRGRVLDACAGAGGKSLHLAALLDNTGRISACDVSDDKLEELRKRARRAGISNLEARRIDREGPLAFVAPFDRVLVDAPCTGAGVLRRNPEARWRLTPKDLVELPITQRAILERVASSVKIDGRLVYATCSIMRAENDAVIDAFLDRNQNFDRVLVKEILGTERAVAIGDGTSLRTSPQKHGTDGFFAAVLRRRR